MVHEPDHAPLGDALASILGRAGPVAAAIASALLGLALLTELLRPRRRALRLIALLDAALPLGARTAAVSLLTVAASFSAARPAAAEGSVRGWLGHATTSTTVTAPVATREALDQLVEPASPPTGPVVLIPPAVEERPAPAPAAPAPRPAEPVAPVARVVPAYVVQPGDCLWTIAARQLGAGAGDQAIDAGWRRIYDTNRAAIGDNPSLIHIGLVLRLPPLDAQP